jgi:hypothetical protein
LLMICFGSHGFFLVLVWLPARIPRLPLQFTQFSLYYRRICGTKQLRTFLKDSESLDFIFDVTRITADDLIIFLIYKSHLKKVKFLTPREETLYLWKNPNEYVRADST